MPPKYNLIQSVLRAMSLLEYIGSAGHNQGITAISEHLGLHKSTCFGLLYTLEQDGYIVHDAKGRYSLGIKAFELGSAYLANVDIRQICRPYLAELMEISGETVHLAIREGLNAVYIDKIQGPRAMSIQSRVGSRAAIHCSGVGKAILAFMSPDERAQALAGDLEVFTSNTLTDRKKLMKKLDEIKKNGFALDEEEIELGLYCVGVPIFNSSGEVTAGISIAGPTSRFGLSNLTLLLPRMLEATKAISAQLGYKPKSSGTVSIKLDEKKIELRPRV